MGIPKNETASHSPLKPGRPFKLAAVVVCVVTDTVKLPVPPLASVSDAGLAVQVAFFGAFVHAIVTWPTNPDDPANVRL
jgi:hypothetical protein